MASKTYTAVLRLRGAPLGCPWGRSLIQVPLRPETKSALERLSGDVTMSRWVLRWLESFTGLDGPAVGPELERLADAWGLAPSACLRLLLEEACDSYAPTR